MARFSFNTSEAPVMPSGNRGPLPAGTYEMMVIASDVKAAKSGNGEYIELEMQVLDGEHSGRRHWERLNVVNSNKQAEDIAKAALAQLCSAVGLPVVEDTDELHDKPFMARVEIDRKDPTRNRIMGYAPAGAAAPAAPAARPAAPPVRPAAPAGAKPWAR